MPPLNLNEVAILGWSDDSHYLIRNYDADKNLVTYQKSTLKPEKVFSFRNQGLLRSLWLNLFHGEFLSKQMM